MSSRRPNVDHAPLPAHRCDRVEPDGLRSADRAVGAELFVARCRLHSSNCRQIFGCVFCTWPNCVHNTSLSNEFEGSVCTLGGNWSLSQNVRRPMAKCPWFLTNGNMASRSPQRRCTFYSPLVSDTDPDYTRRCPMDVVVKKIQTPHTADRHDAGCGGAGDNRGVDVGGHFRARRGRMAGMTLPVSRPANH